jgi:nitrogen fixation/metabolism regulation signal transduction histidine kinase
MPNRRRRFFVKAGGQRGLLAGVLILVLALIIIASGLFYILANRNLQHATYRAHFETLRNTMQMLLPWLVIVNLVGLVVVLALAIFFTHKIAGPSYHLICDLKKIQDGDLTIETAFRKGDGLKDVATAMSGATTSLRVGITEIKEKVNNLADMTNLDESAREKIVEIMGKLDKLKT